MSERVHCDEEACVECARIIVRAYRELRRADYSDRDAFISAVRVLELRHPGHDRWFYFRNVARALGEEPSAGPANDNGID
jgi:hypothetical protein